MDVIVCERWRLYAEEERADGWFLDWARRKPTEVSAHLTAGFCAYLSLQLVYDPGELTSAREYFGGLGAQALMIQDGVQPLDHTVLDFSRPAVDHLRTVLGDRPVHVEQRDSYAADSYAPAALVGLDFGDLTAWRLRPGQPHRTLLDRVMAGQPRAVVLTDVAGPRLHLHRERYGEVLHMRPERIRSYAGYLHGLLDWLRAHYGYHLVRGYYHRWSAVLALAPADVAPMLGSLEPVPDRPRGLEIL